MAARYGWASILVAGLALVVAIASFGKVTAQPDVAAVVAEAHKPTTQTSRVIMGEGKIVGEVDGKEELIGEFHRWEPDVIVVRKGDTVVLNVENPRKHSHTLAIEEFGLETQVLTPRGGKDTLTFVADKAGVFTVKCDLPFDEAKQECDPDHKDMVGYLVVLGGPN